MKTHLMAAYEADSFRPLPDLDYAYLSPSLKQLLSQRHHSIRRWAARRALRRRGRLKWTWFIAGS